jgi:hypothetical protein
MSVRGSDLYPLVFVLMVGGIVWLSILLLVCEEPPESDDDE